MSVEASLSAGLYHWSRYLQLAILRAFSTTAASTAPRLGLGRMESDTEPVLWASEP